MDNTLKAAGVSLGLLVVGVALGVAIAPEDAKERSLIDKASEELKADAKATFSPGEYSAAVLEARAADPTLVDLLSPEIAPGGSVDIGANFPRGARLTEVELIGDAKGAFAVSPDASCVDSKTGTYCSIHGANGSDKLLRLTAFVKYRLEPLAVELDAGVP